MANLLTRDEEYALGTTVQAGLEAQKELDAGVEDQARITELNRLVHGREEAVATFFERNLALVHSLAHKHQRAYPTNLEHDELVNNGIPGLLKAIDKFDPERGFKFSTSATWWIRQAISRGTNYQHRTIRLPEHKIQDLVNINRLAADTGLPVNDTEFLNQVQEELGLSPAEVNEITSAVNCGSLDRVIGSSEGTPWTLMNVAEETHRAPAAEELALAGTNREAFSKALSSLTPEQRAVIFCQYKMPNEDGDILKAKDVRAKLGVTQPKLKALLAEGLHSLRNYFDAGEYEMSDFLSI